MSAAGGIKLSLPIPASPLELAATAIMSSSSCGVLTLPHDNGMERDNGSDKDISYSGRTSLEGASDDGITGESAGEPMTTMTS